MGNDHSHLTGIDVEDKAVEIADFWSQHSASLPKSQLSNLTVFIGELFVSGPLWTVHTPLEKCSKNLMIHRHPCILKYISSWSKSSKFYLAVEHVKPLSHVFSSLNTLQLCIGLHSILKALCFLHEKALVSHNNVCLASLYITNDGNWKLGGMEFTCKYNELTRDFSSKSKPNRYSASIDPNEEEHLKKSVPKEFIDTYAFYVLVTELLKSDTTDSIPSLEDFKQLCNSALKNINVMERPKLSDLLQHQFFNHDFILIHSFLIELPLKSDDEKLEFFSNLSVNLMKFDESLVAGQLSSLLLSRMVLLNPVAQKELLPQIFGFRQDDENGTQLFSEETFKKYLVPRILEIFSVRDAQIRLLLLNHFKNYIHAFSEEELQSYILPELLVGIKDTNDLLVSVTLEALSVLVLILGSNTVIGGKRAKLFTDGRPTTQNIRKTRHNSKRFETSEISSITNEINLPIIPNPVNNLPERQRPDGEEVETSTDEVEQQSIDEELEWEDWDIHETNQNQQIQNEIIEPSTQVDTITLQSSISLNNSRSIERKNIRDIVDLDIKSQRNVNTEEDIDFFQDMEPEIKTSTKYLIDPNSESSDKFSFNTLEGDQEDGWGEEDWG